MPGPVDGGCLIRLTSGGPPDLYLPLLRVTPNTRLQPGSPGILRYGRRRHSRNAGRPGAAAAVAPAARGLARGPAELDWVRSALCALPWMQPLARAPGDPGPTGQARPDRY